MSPALQLLRRLQCSKCGVWLTEQSFRRNAGLGAYTRQGRRPICTWCEQESNDERKRQNRFRTKARTTLGHHARKFQMSPQAFAKEFGWEVEIMARDAERTYLHECPDCHVSFAEMDANGLDNLTLDIWDPRELPYYDKNTRWVCRTDNNRKGDKTPTEWAALLLDYQHRKKELESARLSPQNHGLLFWPGEAS